MQFMQFCVTVACSVLRAVRVLGRALRTRPTTTPLKGFRPSSEAEISGAKTCKKKKPHRVCNVYMFQQSFHFCMPPLLVGYSPSSPCRASSTCSTSTTRTTPSGDPCTGDTPSAQTWNGKVFEHIFLKKSAFEANEIIDGLCSPCNYQSYSSKFVKRVAINQLKQQIFL